MDNATSTVAAKLIIVCAWCQTARQQTLAAKATGAQVSHGMCPACAAQFEAVAVSE